MKKILFICIGQPIGWCISDRETTEVVELFLQCIKEKSPQTQISVVMTDDGNIEMLNLRS